ncbi:dTDP-4-dehydrorhamnose 3,5-epimerase [Candidatus Pseudothioglobus sp. Uisw_086]|uniref:dTDP-4-dehydrorhamnose 3,5-epimerase n=1 Tax=Candidatus Pseudothioglobus sp. Uisw_086 TaxID=3230998 RepID=UPI003A86154B
MKYIRQKIPDLLVIEPAIHKDLRGYFFETFRKNFLEQTLKSKINFVQDNESMSSKGVLRGLHYQISPHSQSKLVRVVSGSILDVAVDIRNNSPTFGMHIAVELNQSNKRQLFIPKGFAHGFLVLSDSAVVSYKTDNYYSKDSERGIAYNDPKLSIDWMLKLNEIIVSDKDKVHPNFSFEKIYF